MVNGLFLMKLGNFVGTFSEVVDTEKNFAQIV